MRKKTLFIVIVIAVICVLSTVLILALRYFESGQKTEPVIYVPLDESYKKAWEFLLPKIQEQTGLENLQIKTYKTPQEIEHIFKSPEKYNLICAEIPVTGEFQFSELAQKGYLKPIEGLKREFYIPSLFNVIQKQFDPQIFYALPYSCDLWVFLQRKKPLDKEPKYEIAVPGKDVENVFAMLTEVLSSFSNTPKDISLKQALLQLQEYSSNKTYQNNPFTYTNYDVQKLVLDGQARYTPISVSQFLSMSYEEQSKFSLQTINDKVIANATVLIFPNRKKSASQKTIITAQKVLSDPSVNFRIADARNWQPIRINTSSRNIAVSNIREEARKASYSGIPKLHYSSIDEKEKIFNEIRKTLSTQ